MKFYSTNNPDLHFSPEEAVLKSLPADNGLFMPETLPLLSAPLRKYKGAGSLTQIAQEVACAFFAPEIPRDVLEEIAAGAASFPVPLRQIHQDTYILELFHGPTLAFKDMGARFMARLMSWLNRNEQRKLTVLVATSGDTGSAVAHGFLGVEGIEVVILYPSGKVSPLQEKQLTTCGGNITALEIQGSFDDCQKMVKTAFLDPELNAHYRLTSANSINIARLIPQMFYYLDAIRQLPDQSLPPVFVVPSGNFGNLTAGLFAQACGMPARGFVAATNRNDSVVRYLEGEAFSPAQTIPTLSNAMDVGNPSNFVRMLSLFGNDRERMRQTLKAYSFTDEDTLTAMRHCYRDTGYMLDPHSAVGWLGWEKAKASYQAGTPGIILETAHPAKFPEVVEQALGIAPEIPEAMQALLQKEKDAVLLPAEYATFKEFMLSR